MCYHVPTTSYTELEALLDNFIINEEWDRNSLLINLGVGNHNQLWLFMMEDIK